MLVRAMSDNVPIDVVYASEEDTPELRNSTRDQHNARTEDLRLEQDGSNRNTKPNDDVPPDGGYGWVCVACVFWINAHTWGVNSSYGVFLSYYLSHNVFPNTSALEYAFTGGLSISCAMLVAPLATYLINKCGTRLSLNLGVFFETISFIGASFATKTWHIFLSQGVCFGFGMGFLFVGTIGIAPQWFSRRRGVANGITAAGSGIGGLMYSLATGAMIPRLGLAWTFRVLAIVCFSVNVVAANLLRDRNKAIGSRVAAFHVPLFKRLEFLLYLGWGILSMLGYVALLFSLANFALSVGLSPHQGSIVSALLNLGQGLGRPFVGLFSDQVGRINMATFLTFLCGFFCFVIWIFATNMGVLCFFAIIVGPVAGTYWATVSSVLAEIIGLKELPSGLSITWITLVPPTTVAEAIALALRDSSQDGSSYLQVQIFTACMYVGAAGCLWLVRGWKVRELALIERKDAITTCSYPVSSSTEKETGLTPAHITPHISTEDTSRINLWDPVTVWQGMVSWKRV
ncbi:hypothetical protein DTO207G8_5618 [Paecilomyces variotii]|nr:hypothetical protein DTO207G8_5618 [Paecilomyces variotii]KAJ9382488.1 hypothetical protein DTO063F5_5664 [Paecilomyces variotii]